MSFEMPELIELTRPTGKNRKRPQHWSRDAVSQRCQDPNLR
jgi:hypothetical protein